MIRTSLFRRSRLGAFALSVAAGCLLSSSAAAQKVRPVLVVDHTGVETWMPDAHDAGVRRAVSMLPDRLAELPAEIPDMDREMADVIRLLVTTAAQPGRFSLTYNPNNPTGFFGYGLVISAETEGREHAGRLQELTQFAVDQADGRFQTEPSELVEGFTQIPTPGGTVHFGPRNDNGQWRYEIIAGSVDDPGAGFDQFTDLADGAFEPVMRARLDLTALTAAVNTGQMMAGRDGQQFVPFRRLLERAHLLGDHAMNFEYAGGHSEDATRMMMRADRAKGFFEFLRLPTDTIPRSHLSAIPSDSYYATLARLDMGFVEAIMDLAAEFDAPVSDFEAEFRNQLGLDLREDILSTLGGSVGYYLSEPTGGGGLTSAVLMSTFKDRERFLSTHARLVEMANDARRHIPEGFGRYILLDSWKHAGADLMSLRFPGLPIPLEITYAVTDDWLLLAPTPQGAIAAVAQATGKGDKGLLGNPRFAEYLDTDAAMQSFQVVDGYHTMRGGYPLVQFIGSALANAVRSPGGGDREPGLVVPTFNDLRDDIKATVTYTVWDEDALMAHTWGDRSFLAMTATQFGAMGGGGGSLSSALPAIMQGLGQNRGGGGPIFMKDPPVGPVFAGVMASAPLPFTAAALQVYAASLEAAE